MMRPVIQSYKKGLDFAPAAHAAGGFNNVISTGTDSVAAGQTAVTDSQVPTGSLIKYIEIHYAVANLVSIASFLWLSVQRADATQVVISPRTVGGNAQRNQVLYQGLRVQGADQNNNYVIKFKVPKRFQRVKEGSTWNFRIECDTIFTDCIQIIYKFYR